MALTTPTCFKQSKIEIENDNWPKPTRYERSFIDRLKMIWNGWNNLDEENGSKFKSDFASIAASISTWCSIFVVVLLIETCTFENDHLH